MYICIYIYVYICIIYKGIRIESSEDENLQNHFTDQQLICRKQSKSSYFLASNIIFSHTW